MTKRIFLLAAGLLCGAALLGAEPLPIEPIVLHPALFAHWPMLDVKSVTPFVVGGGGGAGGGGGVTIGTTTITGGTSTRVLFDDVGVVGESAGLTYVKGTGTLTATAMVGGNLTDSALTAGRVTFSGTAGLLADDADMTFATDTLSATKLISSTSVSTPLVFSPIATGTLALNATAPAATIGASQVGKAASLTASAAVASTDTAGAAAGGSVTITSGSAARFTSGDANGGNINLTTGTGIGAGTSGQVVLGNGSFSVPSIGIADKTGLYFSNGAVAFTLSGGGNSATLNSSGFNINTSSLTLTFFGDTGITRTFTNVVGGNASNTWIQNTGGVSRVSGSDVTNATNTFANITGMSHTVTTARKYGGRMTLKVNNTTAAEGIKLDFNGGSAAMTSFWAACHQDVGGTVVVGTAISTSLSGVISFTTITGETIINCDLAFVPSSTSTFIPRQAEAVAHTSGTLSVEVGSFLLLEDIP